jgi:DNA-binding SARP family transcriptional activator
MHFSCSQGVWPKTFLGLLGGFELRLDSRVIALPMGAKRLLAFLALRSRPVARPFVSQSLWLDATERHANGNLRSALWRIYEQGAPLVEVMGGQLSIDRSVVVDFRSSAALARNLLRGAPFQRAWGLDETMLTEDLLPDWYDEWVVAERERYRQLRLHALECLSLQLISFGRFSEAIQLALASVAGDPLRETANVVLIRAHLAEGNLSEALRQYRSYRDLLKSELGVGPSPAVGELLGYWFGREQPVDVVTPG